MVSIITQDIHLDYPVLNYSAKGLPKKLFRHVVGGDVDIQGNHAIVRALKGVSIEAVPGDRIALVGNNGAGKSTLLRVLSGIYEPDRGHVKVEGRVSSFLGRNLGIDNNATGYDNIYVSGLIWGMSPKEIGSKTEQIAEFTELGDYLHMPVRTYSKGMLARLTFAIAVSQEPEILLIDEGVGAGDRAFKEKARQAVSELAAGANILFMALHSLQQLREICNKCLWLHKGQVRAFGEFDEVAKQYEVFTQGRISVS